MAMVNPAAHRRFAHRHPHLVQQPMDDLEAVLLAKPLLDLFVVRLQRMRRLAAGAERLLVQPGNLSLAGHLAGRTQPTFSHSQISDRADHGLVAAGLPVDGLHRMPQPQPLNDVLQFHHENPPWHAPLPC